jgi:protein-tyrosine-phosphatase/nucleoside 2-deoxyribosyltransferase
MIALETASPVLLDYSNPRTNVFLMMRFEPTPQHGEIQQAITEALRDYGLHALRADQREYTPDLWANVRAYMDACSHGIAVFEQINEQDFNPNVSLELGYMLAQGKRCLLLKEQRVPALHVDVVGHLYKPFDSYRITETIAPRVTDWLRDIGVAKAPGEKLVLFISYGGTCRCAMAKIMTREALRGRELPFRLRVESVAHAFGEANHASRGARRAIFEKYGADYLEDHVVTRRNKGIISDADVILVMEDKLRKDLPPEKTFLLREFFGGAGEVTNPWPDSEDVKAAERYRTCLNMLVETIEPNVDKLVEYLNQSEH